MSSLFDQLKTVSDQEACALLGTTLEQVEADAARYESGDFTGWEFGTPIDGIPQLPTPELRTTSVKLYDHELQALDAVAKREGISRSALIRRAVDRELVALS